MTMHPNYVFENGDLVFTHSAPVGSRKITWIPGVVRCVTGPLSYELEIEGQGIGNITSIKSVSGIVKCPLGCLSDLIF